MRLLNTTTLTLKFFPGKEKPTYATLSHTWGDNEILFQDVGLEGLSWASEKSPQGRRKESLAKILGSCRRAKANGHEWIWIDTCCIDKSSSAELSEAINSMFRWYAESAICYAYLSDVHGPEMDSSRWFSRGWTLQELIAPPNVEFFDASWEFVGDRNSLAEQIARISGIGESILRHGHHRRCALVRNVQLPRAADIMSKDESSSKPGHLHRTYLSIYCKRRSTFNKESSCNCGTTTKYLEVGTVDLSKLLAQESIATRMSWASKRQTTREEDTSYCLLGLFNINMPLIYGEGGKAFFRLLGEVIQNSNDQSILTWQSPVLGQPYWPVSPSCYPWSSICSVKQWATWEQRTEKTDMVATSRGLLVDILVCTEFMYPTNGPLHQSFDEYCLGVLDCTVGSDLRARPAIMLRCVPYHEHVYYPEGQMGFTYMVQMQDGTQKPSKTGEVLALYSNGHVEKTGFQVNLQTAKVRTITLRNPLVSEDFVFGLERLGTRIFLEGARDYTITHSVPDLRPDPIAGSIAMSPSSHHQSCILFLESASGPRFTVAWAPRTTRSLQQCSINDIDDIKHVLSSRKSLRSDDEYWELAKDETQEMAKHIVIALFGLRHVHQKAPQKDKMTRDGVAITAEVVEERFLSQCMIRLHIGITESS